MRYLPGQPSEMAHESTSSKSLIKYMINDPDVLPTVFELYKGEETPLSTILNWKGLKTNGLIEGMKTSKYRVVGSNHVQYAIKNTDVRKMRFVKNSSGVTFNCYAYPTMPGYKTSLIYGYLDSNWAGPKEIIELNDNKTQLYVWDSQLPQEVEPGVWRYEFKIVGNNTEEYCNTDLFSEGAECVPVQTAYEHDFSETGVEKYTFNQWGHTYLGLQRVKYSYSGTAQAMKENKKWTIHNGKTTWLTDAEDQMMKRAAKYHEYSNIFGKQTVSETKPGEVVLKDKQGREIMQGSGIMYQGDGAYEYPYNKWTFKYLESIMQDIDIRTGMDGKKEVVLIGGQYCINGFDQMMVEKGFVTLNHNIEEIGTNGGAGKGVVNSYSFYEFGGVRIIKERWRWLDGTDRPTQYLSDGTRKSAWDGFFVPLGTTSGGDNQVELVQLRAPKMGKVNGINEPTNGVMATSVDGSSVHFLFQTGVISRAKISRIFRPYNS